MDFGSPFSVHRSPRKGWLLGLVVVLVVGWGKADRVQADTCSAADGAVYCAAESCGVWYDPPNNCSFTSQKCVYRTFACSINRVFYRHDNQTAVR